MTTINTVLKTARKTLKLRQEDIALAATKKTGQQLSRVSISQVESGKTRSLNAVSFNAVCDVMGIDPNEALQGKLAWIPRTDLNADVALIDALGGAGAVAEICDLPLGAVCLWRNNGIAPGWKGILESELEKRNIAPSLDSHQLMALQILEKLGPEERAEWFREGLKLDQQKHLKEEVETLKSLLDQKIVNGG